MTLEQLLENRTPGKTMTAGHWSSYCWQDADGKLVVNVLHYNTEMIQFTIRTNKPYMPIPVRDVKHVDMGHGSKSDQDGMNRIFVKLGLPWYYSRKGGSQIIQLIKTPQHPDLPKYMRDPITRRQVYGYAA